MEWPTALVMGQRYGLLLSGGLQVQGTVQKIEGAWLVLATDNGLLAVAATQILAIALEGQLPLAGVVKSKGAGKTTAEKAGAVVSTADIPDDETLRRIASGILDGLEGPELRAISGLSASQLARVRHAFECARGNVQVEDIPPAARELVQPIRRALGG